LAGRSRFTPQEKVEIVLLGLKSPGSISEVCRRHDINPNTFTRWKKQFINGGMESMKPGIKNRKEMLDRENQKLKQIVGELYVELEYLKKTLAVVK